MNNIKSEKSVESMEKNIFGKNPAQDIDVDAIADMLSSDPEKIREFDEHYREYYIDWKKDTGSLFETNSKEAAERPETAADENKPEAVEEIIQRIVHNLISDTTTRLEIRSNAIKKGSLMSRKTDFVSLDELRRLPPEVRPMCTSLYMKADMPESSGLHLLQLLAGMKKETDHVKKKTIYGLFRQGMDILDLDGILYAMLDNNPNSMGFWLPEIAAANAVRNSWFKIPETIVVKVPMPILQLTRTDYAGINQTSLEIVNEWAQKVFKLDPEKKYFIKTGTYSSKYDYRNAKIAEDKEVNEIGAYLLYIQYQAQQMASPMTRPVIYGASTTNEWVVREYIEDKENNPTIYKGLPLHTEYRVFVDFDTKEVIGITPYWRPDVMKKHFITHALHSPHDFHDYVIYKAHEPVLMKRYEENKDKVEKHIREMLPYAGLTGQWSVDIMQNGEDFWLIDMATADTSALSDCVKENEGKRIRDYHVEWTKGLTKKLTES